MLLMSICVRIVTRIYFISITCIENYKKEYIKMMKKETHQNQRTVITRLNL